jgi:hypothetical protein
VALFIIDFWSERRDLNSRPLVPQTSALTGLRYAPNGGDYSGWVSAVQPMHGGDCGAGLIERARRSRRMTAFGRREGAAD